MNQTLLHKKWTYLVSRPYTLFGASLYQAWFDPPHILKLFGISIPDNLYIEEHPQVVRRYVIKKQLDSFSTIIKNIIINDRKKAKEILEKGLQLSEDAFHYLKKSPFYDLQSAIDFLIELTLHATVFSYFSYPILKEIGDEELLFLAEKLRAISYYPQIVEVIINPLARKQAGEDFCFMTLSEILVGDSSQVPLRKENNRKNKRFVYAKVSGKEVIYYVDNALALINKLENLHIGESVKGQIAFPGKVQGRVRLVLASNPNVEFNEGDILVVVTSNPTLMPLISKCGAIVSDEGGITSHAAIVSRELKKPCVIGTKFATHIFKEGDFIEVDAHTGIVKLCMKKIIKYGVVLVKDGKFLINRKKGTTLFLMPGGKPEKGESIEDCLVREIKEEHTCSLVRESISFFGDFEDVAANEPNTLVCIKLYLGTIVGEPSSSAEIEEQRWFGGDDDPVILSPIIRNKILPALLEKKII